MNFADWWSLEGLAFCRDLGIPLNARPLIEAAYLAGARALVKEREEQLADLVKILEG